MQCVWLKRIPSESWLNPDLLFAVPAAVKQSCSAGDRWRGMEVSATAQGESEGRPVKKPLPKASKERDTSLLLAVHLGFSWCRVRMRPGAPVL